jgi:hypothetical protein
MLHDQILATEKQMQDSEEENDLFQIGSHMPSLLSQLDAKTDLILLRDLDLTLSTTAETRQSQLSTQLDIARALSRTVAGGKAVADRHHARLTRTQTHEAALAELDRESMRDTATCSDLRDSITGLEWELKRAEESLRVLEEQAVLDASMPPDETLLKLKIARGLGITLIEDSAGVYSKAHIGIYWWGL